MVQEIHDIMYCRIWANIKIKLRFWKHMHMQDLGQTPALRQTAERMKWRKTKGNRGKRVFWVNLQDFGQGKKKTRTAIFDLSQADKWPGLSNSPWFYYSCTWVLLFCTDTGQNKKPPRSFCFRTLRLSRCKVEGCPANLLTCNFKCIESNSCARPRFVPQKKL